MKSVWFIGLVSFFAGIGFTLLSLAFVALVGYRAAPEFVEYPADMAIGATGATGSAGAPTTPTAPTVELMDAARNATITPAQREAIQHAYEAIDKADKSFEYQRRSD